MIFFISSKVFLILLIASETLPSDLFINIELVKIIKKFQAIFVGFLLTPLSDFRNFLNKFISTSLINISLKYFLSFIFNSFFVLMIWLKSFEESILLTLFFCL